MSQQPGNNQQKVFWNWGKGLAVVIALFVITTLGVVFYLVSLDYYMVSENHYEQAAKYQQQIDRIEHARSLENSVRISQTESREIHIQFPAAQLSLKPKGTIRLYRPSNSSLDHSVSLSLDADGKQLISTRSLAKGKWLVQVTWQSGEKEYFEEESIFL
ncbi:FixH family protein [Halalkalibaculum sp. DA3122]|uniref:FixH family protein n=1 Tax=unclassified Halalkalibaculum TaxID=2964617 RepID=UPI0037552FE4